MFNIPNRQITIRGSDFYFRTLLIAVISVIHSYGINPITGYASSPKADANLDSNPPKLSGPFPFDTEQAYEGVLNDGQVFYDLLLRKIQDRQESYLATLIEYSRKDRDLKDIKAISFYRMDNRNSLTTYDLTRFSVIDENGYIGARDSNPGLILKYVGQASGPKKRLFELRPSNADGSSENKVIHFVGDKNSHRRLAPYTSGVFSPIDSSDKSHEVSLEPLNDDFQALADITLETPSPSAKSYQIMEKQPGLFSLRPIKMDGASDKIAPSIPAICVFMQDKRGRPQFIINWEPAHIKSARHPNAKPITILEK